MDPPARGACRAAVCAAMPQAKGARRVAVCAALMQGKGARRAAVCAALLVAGGARAEARGWQILAESGRASLGARGAEASGTPLGIRAAVGVATAVDAQLVAAWSRHALPGSEDLPAESADVAALGAGFAYHLDELPVVPSLGLGPEAAVVRTAGGSDWEARVRLSVSVDWDVVAPLLVGVAAHFHYVPAEFPQSFYLVTVLGVGIHLDAPDYARRRR